MKQFFLSLLLLGSVVASAQTEMTNTTKDWINSNGIGLHPAGVIWSVASGYQSRVLGETYHDTVWAGGAMKFYLAVPAVGGQSVDSVSGLALRYNVHFNEVEVMLGTYKDVKAIEGSKIKNFTLEKQGRPVLFVNSREFKTDKAPKGFFEVLVPGKIQLLHNQRTTVKKPTYNTAMDVGDRDERILMTNEFFVVKNGTLSKLTASRKNLLQVMDDQAEEISRYLKSNELDLKDRNHLIRVFEFYNSKL